MKNIIICDIDGTIANLSHRLHLIKKESPEWDLFHFSADKDEPIVDILGFVDLLADDGFEIHFVTGRPERTRKITEEWLHLYAPYIEYKGLLMREEGDYRPDYILKKEIIEKNFDVDKIFMAIEDRQRVVQVFKEMGLNVLNVGKLEEEYNFIYEQKKDTN